MALKLIWSPKAASHFESIVEHIAQDSELYASLFAKRIFTVIGSIPVFPMSGRVVPEYNDVNLREKIYQNYRIVYRIKNEAIEIAAICHGAMVLKDIR